MKDNENNRTGHSEDWASASDWFNQRQSERINTSGGRYENRRHPEKSSVSGYEYENYRESREEIKRSAPSQAQRRESAQIRKQPAKKVSESRSRKESRRFKEFSRKNKNSGKSKDELRREYAEKTRKRRKHRIIQWFVFTALIFAAIFVAASLTVLFSIEEISVSGDTRYSAEQIIEASGVETGDNLWRTSASVVSAKTAKALPYIGKVKLERKIPSSLILNVEETKPEYAVKSGKKYILVDKTDKVLETNSKSASKLLVLEGVKAVNVKAGETLNSKEPESYQTAKEILKYADENKLKLTSINVGESNNLSAVCASMIRLDLGSATQLTEKMKMANEVISKLKEEGSLNEGVINLKSPTKAFYKDRPLVEATTEPPTESTSELQTDESGNAVTGEAANSESAEVSQTGETSSVSSSATPTQNNNSDIPDPPSTRPQG